MLAQAQQAANFSSFPGLVQVFLDLIYLIIPVIASLALLAFFWGLVKFIGKAGDKSAIADGKSLMIWGTVGLFVMVSIWGLIRFGQSELDLDSGNRPHSALPLLPY